MRFEKSEALKAAEKREQELAKSLSPKKKPEIPGPATVTPEMAAEDLEILENRLTEETKKLAEVIELAKKKKPEESDPDKKVA
jgi:hypothetical protein